MASLSWVVSISRITVSGVSETRSSSMKSPSSEAVSSEETGWSRLVASGMALIVRRTSSGSHPRRLATSSSVGSRSSSTASSLMARPTFRIFSRSEEHTSELQSRQYLVCRLLLEKKKILILYFSFLLSTCVFTYIHIKYMLKTDTQYLDHLSYAS